MRTALRSDSAGGSAAAVQQLIELVRPQLQQPILSAVEQLVVEIQRFIIVVELAQQRKLVQQRKLAEQRQLAQQRQLAEQRQLVAEQLFGTFQLEQQSIELE